MNEKKMKVLVVDDERTVRDFFGEFFKKKNAAVDFEHDGKKAVENATNNDYDLIFMDIVLPEIHGVQAYEKIKELGKKVPVIMMTGYAVAGLVQRARKDGIKHILKKPFTLKELETVYDGIVNSGNA